MPPYIITCTWHKWYFNQMSTNYRERGQSMRNWEICPSPMLLKPLYIFFQNHNLLLLSQMHCMYWKLWLTIHLKHVHPNLFYFLSWRTDMFHMSVPQTILETRPTCTVIFSSTCTCIPISWQLWLTVQI